MHFLLKGTTTVIRQRVVLHRRPNVSSFSSCSSSYSSSCSRRPLGCYSSSVIVPDIPSIHCKIKRHCNHIYKRSSSSGQDQVNTNQSSSQQNRTLSVAIVGTGPSGCYTAKYLLSSFAAASSLSSLVGGPFASIQIDMMDKLPTPFGLVRSGVAPDHPEVKNVMHDFCKLFQQQEQEQAQQQQQQQAQHQIQQPSPQVEFWGNVHVGKDVSLKELQSLYHVVVLAYGCESDQRLGIEGEDVLHGIFSAREFVAWYNGHPEFVSLGNQVGQLIKGNHGKEGVAGEGGEGMNVVVIGQGNVALDCARVLVKGQKGLVETDIASDALNVIGNGVRRTTVLGRRGHIQGAFTIKELRELTKLDHVDFVVKEKELNEGATLSSLEELKGGGARPKVRIDKLLRDVARLRKKKQEDAKEQKEGHQKEVILRFLLNPIKFLPGVVDGTRVGSVLCERTRLEGQPGRQVAVGTGVMEEIPADMVLVSIGYKGVKLPGMDKSLFDDRRGIVRNTHGKVIDNLYVSGWLKRGPSGIIGTNIMDAKDTVSSILKDLEEETSTGSDKMVKGRKGLGELLLERGVRYVDWPSYQRIDAAEMDPLRLRTKNQPREKITSVEEMLTYVK